MTELEIAEQAAWDAYQLADPPRAAAFAAWNAAWKAAHAVTVEARND